MTSFPPRPTEAEALFDFGQHPGQAPANDLEATLRHVQAAVGVAPTSIPPDLKQQIWEDLMATPMPSVGMPQPIPGETRRFGPTLGQWTTPVGRAVVRWQPAISLAIVVAFLAGMIGIAWQRGVLDDSGNGSGDFGNQPTIPFRGQVNQEDLKPRIDPADLPTAEDCTVEPLTVDEVMAILVDPDPSTGWFAESEAGTGYHPTQDTIDAAAETQHMWLACALAGSDFQRWALETPAMVQRDVSLRLPRLLGFKDARAILEEVWETGRSDNFASPRATWSTDYLPIVDTDPTHSWQLPDTHLILGFNFYDERGYRVGGWPAQETVQYARATGENIVGTCYALVMGQSEDRTRWLIADEMPGCG